MGGLVEKRERKKPLGRPRHAWEDNITMDLKKCDGNAWTEFICIRLGTGVGLL
jgi:hypothetical protein